VWAAVKFGLVGVVNTLVDVVLFSLLLHMTSIGIAAANLASYGTGVVVSYFLNKTWTFSQDAQARPGSSFVRFVAVSVLAAGVSSLVVLGLCSFVPPLPAKALSLPVMFGFNFLLVRHFVFRRSDATT